MNATTERLATTEEITMARRYKGRHRDATRVSPARRLLLRLKIAARGL